ncbi:hypothetical protein B0J11DRAFT_264592 [Dendryphion nanum]|uniref:Uncharacterized protein n=1 Tax=Dendryphion nanum TaxID=256645 RepID=A0A9P9DZC8_9PLEO|nr:hypothetical protein B0J11DRAFT_264592 [Dendryphion nanum]
MKFSQVFYSVLAALSVGVNATPIPDTTDVIVVRGTDDTKEYNHFEKVYSSLVKDKYYAFEIQWPRGTGGGETGETGEELAAVRDELGFDHIGIVIGQVTETSIGKPKDKKVKRSFAPLRYDIRKIGGTKNELRSQNWGKSTNDIDRPLKFIKEVKKADFTKFKKTADDWITANPEYNVRTANCNDFFQAMKKAI